MVDFTLEQALPHKPPMRLLDSIISVDTEQAICEAVITQQHIFYEPAIQGVYAEVGIEMMAQTAAVYAYAKNLSLPPTTSNTAYLISIRSMRTELVFFPVHSVLKILATPTASDSKISLFEGQIELNGQSVATAKFSVYKPS